ncbi:MAG TPA: methyltransferase domain-containing protein [Gaiellaceae bacterium]|nr:methyltransferase domain-containing protein [Gaiellaceae bacterium]
MSRDLLRQDEVRALVRDAYAAVDGRSRAVAEKLYSPDELALVPDAAADRALGVGNPFRHARIRPGDTVLDLGCGGGIDSILAARRTGPTGRVLALDFLPEMLERTAAAAREAGLENVESVEGEMEAIPLPDASVDYVVSNGVVNLSPRKARALAECARVLRPGGELCVADVTVEDEELPPEVLTHPAAWAG